MLKRQIHFQNPYLEFSSGVLEDARAKAKNECQIDTQLIDAWQTRKTNLAQIAILSWVEYQYWMVVLTMSGRNIREQEPEAVKIIESFAKNIRWLLDVKGITITKFAEMTGVKKQTISSRLRMGQSLEINTVILYGKALKVRKPMELLMPHREFIRKYGEVVN